MIDKYEAFKAGKPVMFSIICLFERNCKNIQALP